ncbi:magnesium transporter, partial [Tremellales sp. Uapishka_1]
MSPTSPRQIQIDPHLPSPAHHRSPSQSLTSPLLSPSRPMQGQGHRNSVIRGSYRERSGDDMLSARERQMQQDINSAMSMSRARSGSMAPDDGPPALAHRPSHNRQFSSSPIEETPFPMLSDTEEMDMDRARASGFRDHDGEHDHFEEERHEDSVEGGSSQYRLLQRRDSNDHGMGMGVDDKRPGRTLAGLGGMGGVKNVFDFKAMDEFAEKEREDELVGLGQGARWIPDGVGSVPGPRRRSHQSSAPKKSIDEDVIQDEDPTPTHQGSFETNMERTNTMSAFGDDHEHDQDTNYATSPRDNGGTTAAEHTFHRRRQRKLSQSNPVTRRQGKLALFEGFGSQPTANANGGEGEPNITNGTAFKASRQAKNGFASYSDNTPGHDRPYRFSFYSNALPVTIHARSLAELPAENQSFEDLFKGKSNEESANRGATGGEHATDYGSVGTNHKTSGGETPVGNGLAHTADAATGKMSLLAKAAGAAMEKAVSKITGEKSADDDPESFTWWLDVLSPTDEEMRMLSKVFGIHPLTTEDILLEETREKIELFRNYYLVCFRSFDQDPYSQTYLEPLNMYIIVFREGTLSFHFRGTPHPQNVRRRIKHLKDYISVTSDWISYALIDDITDAFGPLIQSIEYEVDSIDELVLILKEAEQSDMLRRIGTCRKKVMGLLRLMGNKADVVKGLAKRCNENWLVAPKSDIGLYLSDIQDHLITMTQNLNHYEKILSRSHSNYLAQISIEMTDANNQINDVLSKLTALGTVLIPMNLVTGLWGMNVHVPGQDIESGYAWFGGIVGGLALFAFLGAWATYKCFVIR